MLISGALAGAEACRAAGIRVEGAPSFSEIEILP
jgi:hypothetical protein